jgi:two-component system, response regulator YesN
MPYRVFFVEDEIVTREGIRDNVDWTGNGFELCGDAPDGEIALPLIQTAKPDVLIADIKMPFMDGLQLCKIVRERMPEIKIIILSGHDEFEYAQQAIRLGVTEYLLKPVTPQDLHRVLQRVAAQLEQEGKERENLDALQNQVNEYRFALRERLLLKLLVGTVSPTEAIEQGQSLGMDLVARHYLVVIIKPELSDYAGQFDYCEYQRVLQLVYDLVGKNPDVFLLHKGWDELVLLMKGSTLEYLEEERDLILERINNRTKRTKYKLTIGSGVPKKRIADIQQSFVDAWMHIHNSQKDKGVMSDIEVDQAELLKLDKCKVENFLRSAVKEDFNTFFDDFIQPLSEAAIQSDLIKNYIYMDIVLTAAKFLSELGGDVELDIPTLNSIESTLDNIKSFGQLREQVYEILSSVLVFRDKQNTNQYWQVIQQAREYITNHYMDPDLSLNKIAAQVNLSPSHFSVVYSHETGQTFKEYLTEIRIKKAKELLRMTNLKSTEISYQVGYSDPHYFSHVFGKYTGFSPKEFRMRVEAS